MAGVPGRSGRRAKPVAKKELAGNPGKRKLNVEQPDFKLVENIDCPEWIGDYGRALWETIVPQLCTEKILAATDIQNVEVYCMAYQQFREAEDHIKTHGLVVEGATGGPIKNPSVTAKNEAIRQMATYGGMLGLDPSSRQRLTGATKPGDNQNPFASLV